MMKFKMTGLAIVCYAIYAFTFRPSTTKISSSPEEIPVCVTEKPCVFKTIFEGQQLDTNFYLSTPVNVQESIDEGMIWMSKAQLNNGGWGAGSHSRQDIHDPHAVNADPATTSMVVMSLLRTGNHLNQGIYAKQVKRGVEFLLDAIESTPPNRLTITEERGTQIQQKLGQNIDAVLTAQCLSNLLVDLDEGAYHERVTKALNTCINKIQRLQEQDGSIGGAGWAGVLQSSLANNALEMADKMGAAVDQDAMKKFREYQKNNFDAESGNVNTEKGAGIVLYSVTGSARASAKQARKVKEEIKKARDMGQISKEQEVNQEVLEEIGFSVEEAADYEAAYKVYNSSKVIAQDEHVMDGFGNNGGEEFISYLQTGESLIVNQDIEWQEWYKKMADRLVTIQNNDGSWSGHHCITSPVFCTATTLLTLSVNNDVDLLVSVGNE